LQEVWDKTDREWVKSYGTLRADYADYYKRAALPIPSYRPFLAGVTCEESLRNPSSIAAAVFLYTPPRFQFSQGAQELLAWALEGETDIAIATALHLSLPAVKMRWRFIYDRVAAVAPELLPKPTGHLSESARGKEKRRSVVEYVRNHPEELRPFAVTRTAAKVASKTGP
jgi:hypothetical protein